MAGSIVLRRGFRHLVGTAWHTLGPDRRSVWSYLLEQAVSDVVFMLITLAGFGLLGLIAKGAERL